MTRGSGTLHALPRGFWPRIVLAWAGIAVVLVIRQLAAIRGFQLADPDDTLRLVQVRDLLAGQGWFELFQYRIDPPAGVATHWSRLVDIPLALAILALTPLLGQGGAELAAVVIVPLLSLLCAMVLTARLAGRLLGVRAAYAACFVWLLALPALTQLQPMRIDHHGWQIVTVLAALNGLIGRDVRRGGWIAGLSLASGLAISLELLPFAVLFAAVLGLRWLREPAQEAGLKHFLPALTLGAAGLYLATRGARLLEPYCDTLSPAYLAGLALASMLVWGIAAYPGLSRLKLAALMAGAAVLAGACYLALAPQCLTGPFAALDPLVRKVWYVNVLEGLPVWRQNWPTFVQMVVPPLAGIAALIIAVRQSHGLRRGLLADYALLLGGSLAIAVLVARFSGVAAAIATVPLGYALAEWLHRANAMRLAGKIAALPLILLILLPGYVAGKVDQVLAQSKPVSAKATEPPVPPPAFSCGLPGSLEALSALPRSTLFAPCDIGPVVLLHTSHSVVATGHHRASAAMRDVIEAYTAEPAAAEAIVRRHGAQYVVSCADLVEARNYRTYSRGGLMAGLLAERAPAWLEPVPLPAAAGELRLWRVLPPAGTPGHRH